MMFKEKYGEWAVIVGASMGIGECCAREFASRGVNVVLVARSEDKLKTLAATIEKTYGVKALPVALDIMEEGAWDILDTALEGLHVGSAVLSAATAYVGSFLTGPPELYNRMMQLNVHGSLAFSQYFGRRFCHQKHGGLLYLGSLSGYFSTPYMALYSATKGFEVLLAESLYTEFKEYNVDVTVGIIGSVDTPGLQGLYPDKEAYAAMKPEPPEDIARECIEAMGQNCVAIPTKAMRRNVGMLRKVFSLDKQITMIGKQTIDATYLGNPPKQFPDEGF